MDYVKLISKVRARIDSGAGMDFKESIDSLQDATTLVEAQADSVQALAESFRYVGNTSVARRLQLHEAMLRDIHALLRKTETALVRERYSSATEASTNMLKAALASVDSSSSNIPPEEKERLECFQTFCPNCQKVQVLEIVSEDATITQLVADVGVEDFSVWGNGYWDFVEVHDVGDIRFQCKVCGLVHASGSPDEAFEELRSVVRRLGLVRPAQHD